MAEGKCKNDTIARLRSQLEAQRSLIDTGKRLREAASVLIIATNACGGPDLMEALMLDLGDAGKAYDAAAARVAAATGKAGR